MTKLNGSLKIAVQKSGRLSKDSILLLRNIGLKFDKVDRQLYAKCKNLDISILFVRNNDIPEFVESGAADIGIVGIDTLTEGENNVKILQNLDFGICNLSVAVKEKSEINSIKELNNKVIATSFPNITKNYFDSKNINIKTIELSGGVELAPNLAISDAIVDIVSSGFTMKMNNLKIIDRVMNVQAVLVRATQTSAGKLDLIKNLVFRIQSVKQAARYKYVMMNLPESKLQDIQNVVPGLKSPTVAKLSKQGWISVQTVILESEFWEIISKLKKYGAEGIIVMPIEKMIL